MTAGGDSTHQKALDNDASERDRLLSAAKHVLQRSGWRFLKIDSVLRQAQLSTRSFYRHFEKKDDLLLAVLERERAGADIFVRRAMEAHPTPAERIAAYIGATLDMAYREDLARPSSLLTGYSRALLPEYPEALDQINRSGILPLVEAIEDGVRSQAFTSSDPEADAWAIFYLVTNLTADQAAVGVVMPRERLEHIVIPFVARALGISCFMKEHPAGTATEAEPAAHLV